VVSKTQFIYRYLAYC